MFNNNIIYKKNDTYFFYIVNKISISIFSRYYIKNNLQCYIIYYLKYAQVS